MMFHDNRAEQNNNRFDLSPYLIHFFRKIDLCGDDVGIVPEEWGPGEIVEDSIVSPLFLLRNAIRLKRLWATWSFRNKRRTIYGPDPAVCFSDMPVAAFIEAGQAREKKGQAMSPIALVLPKMQVHAKGARPAIYGLSEPCRIPKGDDYEPRLLPENALPLSEQYRYVTLGEQGTVDWTHEREWRWPCREPQLSIDDMPPIHGKYVPGLDLTFNGMGVIVRNENQAKKVLSDILVLSDTHAAGCYDFILIGSKIPPLNQLRDPADVQDAIINNSINLSYFYNFSNRRIKALNQEFDNCVMSINKEDIETIGYRGREFGGCWLWLTDPAHEITRALFLNNRIQINSENRYLFNVDAFFRGSSLGAREEFTRRLCQLLLKKYNLPATYHSVVGSSDMDGIPHYSNAPTGDRLIFNHGHDQDDF